MTELDMAYGNPGFLQEYWTSRPAMPDTEALNANIGYRRDCGYPPLTEAIKTLHSQVNNVLHTSDWQVVVGHGATQILEAALYSYKFDRQLQVYARSPHFQRFESMVKLCGRPFKFVDQRKDILWNTPLIEINTHPSNPENKMFDPIGREIIHDCSYLWPTYVDVDTARLFSGQMYVFSLSKLSGHSSTRIGWALVKDPQAATLMREFIEYQSGDVSMAAQAHAHSIISTISKDKDNFFSRSKNILADRHVKMRAIATKYKFKLTNHSGMFAWCEFNSEWHAKEFLTSVGVKAIMGSKLGSDNKHIRLNIGCASDIWNEFVTRTEADGQLEKTS